MSSSARVTTPADVLDRLRPDVWVKGGDYARGEPAEAPVVRRYGGEIVLLPHTSHSTSRIVAAVMQAIYNGHTVVPGEQVQPTGPAWARVLPDRVGQSWFSALRMPACACWPSRSKAGLSSGARRRDGPLNVNSAV